MKKSVFIQKLKDILEVENAEITEETDLKTLEEYDSLSLLAIIAMVDEYFGKKITAADFNNIMTVKSLMRFIGEHNFER